VKRIEQMLGGATPRPMQAIQDDGASDETEQ
jgi:hypothetical protein